MVTNTRCKECSAENWTTDADYGKLVCIECGYQPRDMEEQEIREALPAGAIKR